MYGYFKRLVKFCLKVVITIVIVCGGFAFCFAFISRITGASTNEMTREIIFGEETAKHQFVAIPVTGIIVGDSSDVGEPLGLLDEMLTYGYEVKRSLVDLAEDDEVAGVILDINSPGGTIYGAKAIADGVRTYKEKTGKPVVAFVSGLAASGGYWAAVAADSIIADVGTGVGSIGVISGPFQFFDTVLAQDGGLFSGGVVTQKGIETLYIFAGKYKDFGNPFRRLSQEEIDAMQRMVNNEYALFTSYVSARRNIPQEVITNDIGALLYDGLSAQEKRLIDAVGSREDSYDMLAQAANITDDDYYVAQEFPKKGLLLSLLEAQTISSRPKQTLCNLTKVHLVYHGDVEAFCR